MTTSWFERLAGMESENREPTWAERQLLAAWPTCLVGEQVARGALPADWFEIWQQDRLGKRPSRYARLVELGFGTQALDREALVSRLNAIEDEALRLKRGAR